MVQLKDVLHLYLGCEVMTPDGIGWLASVGRDRRGMDRLLLNDCVKVDFRKIILTQNSVDGYDKKRNWGHYKLKETAYVPLNAADDAEPEFTMPGGIKPFLRPLSSMEEEEINELWQLLGLNPNYESDAYPGMTKRKYLFDFFTAKPLWPARYERIDFEQMPILMTYLLKKGFDLFGLIESGQAIDATTLTPKEKENK